MKGRIGTLVCGLSLAAAATASAQSTGDTGGSVAYIDLADRTVTFADERILHFEPDAKIYIDGRPVTGIAPVGRTWAPVVATSTTTTIVEGPRQPAMAVATPQGVVVYSTAPVLAVTETQREVTVPPSGNYVAYIDRDNVVLIRYKEAP